MSSFLPPSYTMSKASLAPSEYGVTAAGCKAHQSHADHEAVATCCEKVKGKGSMAQPGLAYAALVHSSSPGNPQNMAWLCSEAEHSPLL